MKSELLTFSLCATILLGVFLVAADPIQNTFGATVTIGSPGNTATTTTSQAPINNPANLQLQILARDSSSTSQQLNVSLYDHVNHHFLNNTPFLGLGSIYSPTSLSDFEIGFDSQNLDIMVSGLNMTNISTGISQITIENSNPSIQNFQLYRAYHVELPWNPSSYSSIKLTISLAGVSNVNYGSIIVYRCGNYNIITNVCSDSNGWQPQTISVDSANQVVTLNINHFSVYAVGSGSGSSQVSTTTTSQTTVTTSTSSTSVYNPPASNPVSSNSGGGGGGAFIPTKTTTTAAPTTTTTVLIIKKNSTSSSASPTTETPPITGFLGFSSQFSPLLIVAVIIVASVAAIPFIKSNHSFSGINPFRKSYHTFPTSRKIKKAKEKKNTELKLSL